ncbi:MAG: FtsX-like permease family protein [Blastocatellia bacterium]
MLSILSYITFQQWRQHKLRTMLTLLGIALGVAVFFAVRTANVTLIGSLTETIEKMAGKSTLQIVGGETGFPEAVWDIVRDTPGVKIAEPVVEVVAHTAFEDEASLMIIGVDMLGDDELREYQFDETQSEIGDPLVTLAQPESILISRTFANKHQLKEGAKLPLFTTQGKKEFTVRGIFKPAGIGEIMDGQVAVMDVFNAQFVFGRGKNFDRIDLMNQPDVTVEELQNRLRGRLPAGLEVTRPSARNEGIENAVSSINIGMTVTSFIALLTGVFIIFNTLSISVSQRWKEIGILRALGVERRNIQRMFLGEAVILGLLGSLLGVALGFFLAVAVERTMSDIISRLFDYHASQKPPAFRLNYALWSLLMGMVASVVAAVTPARAASRLNPVLALHNIETRQSESVLGRTRLLTGVLLLVISMALTYFTPLNTGMYIQFSYSVMIILGMVLILPTLSVWTARMLRPLMDRVFGSEGVLAADTMIQAPRRTSATVGALMVGLMFVLSTAAFVESNKGMFRRWMRNSINSDLFVTTSQDVRSRTWHFSEELSHRIMAMAGVKRIENVRFLFVPYAGSTVALISLELDGWFARAQDTFEEGDIDKARAAVTKGEGALVSRNFANRYKLGVGDTLQLVTPTEPFARPIAGIIEDYSSEKGTVFLTRELYKQYWRDASIDILDITLNEGVDRNAFKTTLQRQLKGEQRAFIYTQDEYRDKIMGLLDGFFAMMNMQMVIAIFIGALGIVNTLFISVSERKRELGVIRAIGGLRGQVRRMILLEAVAIAIAGLISGVIAGLLNTYFLVRTAAAMIGGYTMPYVFPVRLVLISLPVLIIIALLAAWWPARKAVSIRVIEAIGYE